MKVDKKSDNCYRVRKQVNGAKHTFYFDHYPSDVDIALALAEQINTIDTKSVKQTFEVCAIEYIGMKESVLSPSTVRGYRSNLRSISDGFKAKNINDITQIDIQMEINVLSKDKSSKTIHNIHGFISAILSTFRPNLIINTTLPQKVKFEGICPSEEDIKLVLDAVKGTRYHIPYQLGVLGMRRSEICAALPSDISGNFLTINKAKVNSDDGYVIKKLTKTTEGKRKIYLSDSLIEEIQENNVIFEGGPSTLLEYLHRLQKRLGIPQFRFHDLRAFYCSYAHSCGIPDTIIMATGGWKSDYTMKQHYRRAMESEVEYFQKALVNDLLS